MDTVLFPWSIQYVCVCFLNKTILFLPQAFLSAVSIAVSVYYSSAVEDYSKCELSSEGVEKGGHCQVWVEQWRVS